MREERRQVKNYIGGGEESYGFLVRGIFDRDKDAVSACVSLVRDRRLGKRIKVFEFVFNLLPQDAIRGNTDFSNGEGISVVEARQEWKAEAIEAMMLQVP